MSARTILFLAAIFIFLAALIVVTLHYYLRARRASSGSWEHLLERLAVVDRVGVAKIALDYKSESARQDSERLDPELKPSQIFGLIGGLPGLEILEKNSEVLIDMAFFVQQWYPEALVLAEELRLNAREIEWHVERLRGAARTGNLEVSFANYAQPAIAKYYVMTQRVLALYERGNLPMLADLQRAI